MTRYCYDDLDRLITARVTSGSTAWACGDAMTGTEADWFGYGYDAAGNVTDRTRKDTTAEAYAYNATNQLCWKLDGTAVTRGLPPVFRHLSAGSVRAWLEDVSGVKHSGPAALSAGVQT